MAKDAATAPKADQPRATTESLRSTEKAPGLTYRTTGIKNYAKSNRRDYSRK